MLGTTARIMLLKSDYRAYPSSPNGVLNHLVIGFIAAALGAVAVPAVIKRDFVAATFLALAIQQLREVRRVERESLNDLEQSELIRRGPSYIDGLAKGFESRNYVALLVALFSGAAMAAVPLSLSFWLRTAAGIAAGSAVFLLIKRFTGHRTVGEIAKVAEVSLSFQDSRLYAGDVYLDNIGLETQRQRILEGGAGVRVDPLNDKAATSLANYGQRQAMLHELARAVGVNRFYGMRRDFDSGSVLLYLVPMRKDIQTMIEVVRLTPLLESSQPARD